MPIGHMGGCECPDKTGAGQASLHLRIVGNVVRIVDVYKVMIVHLPKDCEGSGEQKEAYY